MLTVTLHGRTVPFELPRVNLDALACAAACVAGFAVGFGAAFVLWWIMGVR